MAQDKRNDKSPVDPAEVNKQVEDLLAGKSLDEIRQMAMSLLGTGPNLLDMDRHRKPRTRRRPQRDDVVTYRVRIDISGSRPPIWRRLELASDILLDELHTIMQSSFAWTDSHLHVFAIGSSVYDRDADRYLCPFDVEEGETGVPEEEVRLDEVLVEVGDTLLYEYDYGDGWEHKLKLEAVTDRVEDTPAAVCVDGRRAGPPEDCGGIGGYEAMLAAAADPSDPDHADALQRVEYYLGDKDFDPARFDPAEVNQALSYPPIARPAPEGSPLGDLLQDVRLSPVAPRLDELLAQARLDEPVLVDAAVATRMVRRYAWLVDRVGEQGIRLTSAGYLPPTEVSAAMSELGMHEEWIGKGNREDLTEPVASLRETARRFGLVRKHRGRLVRTKIARTLVHDPVGLWWHIARRLPLPGSDQVEQHAGLVRLLLVAAGNPEHAGDRYLLRDALTDLGWRLGPDDMLDEWAASRTAFDTSRVLRHLGVFPHSGGLSEKARTSQGVVFARAALIAAADG